MKQEDNKKDTVDKEKIENSRKGKKEKNEKAAKQQQTKNNIKSDKE